MKTLKVFILVITISIQAFSQTDLMNVKPWAYWLQDITIQTIVDDTTFELIVMDYSQDGLDDSKFTPAQIDSIKNSGKYAISYISIGEAEDYRYYWDNSWETSPPSWLGPENPDWEGNYKVRFWETQWQDIIFAYIDTIINQGFDGIYMDIIDGYYYWSEENAEQAYADSLMCQFIINIRNHVNSVTGNTDFILIPQNGEDVYDQENVSTSLKTAYFDAINAIGVEDVFFPGDLDENNTYEPDTYRIGILQEYFLKNKQIFSVEYLTDNDKITQYKNASAIQEFVPYVCTRDLAHLCGGITLNLPELEANFTENIILYPNPAQNYLKIYLSNYDNKNSELQLFNSIGQIIRKYNYTVSDNNIITISLTDLKTGLYFLKFKDKDHLKTYKVIISY